MPAGQPGHLQHWVSLWNIFSWKDLEAARGLCATTPLPPPAFPTERLEWDPAPVGDRAAHVAPA